MKIKIIDLLNKIANGEEVPKKIKWGDFELEWEELCYHDYKFIDTGNHLLFQGFATSVLNNEVEIIEEPKKIEKLEAVRGSDLADLTDKDMVSKNNALIELCKTLNNINNKVNELIDEINNLKEND